MICKKCGNPLDDNARRCDFCGAPVEADVRPGPSWEPKPAVSFPQAVKLYFTRGFDFRGRSRRSEYWWATLFVALVNRILQAVEIPVLLYLWAIVVLIFSTALVIRRLHDVGKSGWWYLFVLLPVIGWVVLLVQYCKDSGPDNRWGPNPKY